MWKEISFFSKASICQYQCWNMKFFTLGECDLSCAFIELYLEWLCTLVRNHLDFTVTHLDILDILDSLQSGEMTMKKWWKPGGICGIFGINPWKLRRFEWDVIFGPGPKEMLQWTVRDDGSLDHTTYPWWLCRNCEISLGYIGLS